MAIITVSRGSERGGREVAEAVANAMGCDCVGREIVVEAAVKLGVPPDLVDMKIARPPGWWERLTSERRDYVVALQAALADRIIGCNLVYHSYAGHLLLRSLPFVLRVRVIASADARAREEMEHARIDESEARARIAAQDEQRLRWTKSVYGVDWTDASLYDIVLSLDRMTIDRATRCVVDAASAPQFGTTSAAVARLQDFALESRVSLALQRNPSTRGHGLRVTARSGGVLVAGSVTEPSFPVAISEQFRRDLRSAASGVDGVSSVELDLESRAVDGAL